MFYIRLRCATSCSNWRLTIFFRAKWTAAIHREWIEAILKNEPHRERARLERTRDLMDAEAPDALITDYESILEGLSLPDPNDRHVLAAAIVGECDLIVTQNLKDFPEYELAPYGIQAQHPDDFLMGLLVFFPKEFCAAIREVRVRLQNPPYTLEEYLATLKQLGLVKTAAQLDRFSSSLTG